MFDVGWSEMLVIAVVMIVVVGPKDLPRMLRTFGKTTAKLRTMAGDFQKQFNEALKEAELDDVKKSVDELRNLNPAAQIKKQLNPFEKVASDVRAGLDAAMKPKPSTSAEPASPVAHVAEPLKTGAAQMPGVAGPEAMPAAPIFPAASDPAPTADPAPIAVQGVQAAPAAPAAIAAKAETAPAKRAAKPAAPKPAAASNGKQKAAGATKAAAPKTSASKTAATEAPAVTPVVAQAAKPKAARRKPTENPS